MTDSIFASVEAAEAQQQEPADNKVSSTNYVQELAAKQNAAQAGIVNEHDRQLKEKKLAQNQKALDMVNKPLSESEWDDVLRNDPVFYFSQDAANLRRQHRALLGMHFYS